MRDFLRTNRSLYGLSNEQIDSLHFLGERETFRRVFRNQIEKEGDLERQQLLASRVRPFLLRRAKAFTGEEL